MKHPKREPEMKCPECGKKMLALRSEFDGVVGYVCKKCGHREGI